MIRAVRDICVLETATTKGLCLEKLRTEKFDAVIVCDQLADGHGLELLAQIAQHYPSTLRAFAADPRRLMQMRGRMGPFNLLQAVRYPIVPAELRAMLKSAQAAHAADADTTNVQHIVLEGDASAEPNVSTPSYPRLEIAPDWRPEDGVPIRRAKLSPPEVSLNVEIPHWTVEDAPSNIASLRTADFKRNIGAARELVRETQPVIPLRTHKRRAVIALTRDQECLDIVVAALAGRAVTVLHLSDEVAAAKALKQHGAIAVLVDIAVASGSPRRFLERICLLTADTFILAVGRASDSVHIAPLLSRGSIHRFLVKPMNRAQTRGAFDKFLSLSSNTLANAPSDAVPFASLIDRVTVTDFRKSLDKIPWHVRFSRIALRNWHWALGGTLLGLAAMLALAFLLSA
jgi:DNA-binding response OmpR family regulator